MGKGYVGIAMCIMVNTPLNVYIIGRLSGDYVEVFRGNNTNFSMLCKTSKARYNKGYFQL